MMQINYFKKEYENDPEAIGNKYVIRGMTVSCIFMLLVWILNEAKVFMVDELTMLRAMFFTVIEYLVGCVIIQFVDLRNTKVKYFLLIWSFVIYTTIVTLLTFHAYLVCIVPVLFSSMYTSKSVLKWTYVMTVISIAISVFGGYYIGLCDTNMVLLSGEPMAEYIGADNTWLLTKINDQVVFSLTLFFVVPRSLSCLAIATICSDISRIHQENVQRTLKLTEMATIDEMTGLYNRNHYLEVLAEGCSDEEKIAVIFWDINELKHVNDTMGHEAGDELIRTVGSAIKQITDEYANAYRIGGDEFVMIIRGGEEEVAIRKIKECEMIMQNAQGDRNISTAVGYSFGSGEDLLDVIRDADQKMYRKKKEHKTSVTDQE